MLIHIPNVLTKSVTQQCRREMAETEWIDGRVTAGTQSGTVKHNKQLPEGSAVAQKMGNLILDALGNNSLFVSAALPLKIFPPLFNSYSGGEHFGTHVDNAIRAVKGTPVRIRTDLSATLFFSEPNEYEGGELVIEDNYGSQSIKLAAGDMVLYPSSSLHHVTPVTKGERVCSFFWMQSMVRNNEQRAILFDLDQSIQELSRLHGVEHPLTVKMSGIYHNLIRQWADS